MIFYLIKKKNKNFNESDLNNYLEAFKNNEAYKNYYISVCHNTHEFRLKTIELENGFEKDKEHINKQEVFNDIAGFKVLCFKRIVYKQFKWFRSSIKN